MIEDQRSALETGWEPDTPRRDTIVRAAVLAHADAYEHLAGACGGRVRRDAGLSLADAGSPSPFFNTAILLQPAMGDDFEAVTERVGAFFGQGRGGPALVISPWPTPRTLGEGRELVGHPPLMVRPPGGSAPALAEELRVEEVADDEMLSAFEAVLVEGYPLDELRPPRPGCVLDARALEDGSYRCWLGSVARRPVAAAAAHVGDDAIVLSWVATLPEARGRGYGAALTAAVVWSAPRLPTVLISSDPGRPVYERLGFLAVLRFTAWFFDRGRPGTGTGGPR